MPDYSSSIHLPGTFLFLSKNEVAYLTPCHAGAKNDVEAFEKIIANYNDGRSTRRPSLAGTESFNARRRKW